MKKSLILLGLALALFSCNNDKGTATSGFKTAYVDTSKLSKEYEAFKELESQSKVKQEEMGRELDVKVQQLKLDYAAAQNEAAAKGQQWAQLKAQELQKRERELGMMQETMVKTLQDEFGAKNDSAVSKMKKYIKDYGKKNGYDYIYGSNDATTTVIYAKDGYDVTEEILKELNSNYKSTAKETPATTEAPAAEKK
jgi:outer membrane protein